MPWRRCCARAKAVLTSAPRSCANTEAGNEKRSKAKYKRERSSTIHLQKSTLKIQQVTILRPSSAAKIRHSKEPLTERSEAARSTIEWEIIVKWRSQYLLD